MLCLNEMSHQDESSSNNYKGHLQGATRYVKFNTTLVLVRLSTYMIHASHSPCIILNIAIEKLVTNIVTRGHVVWPQPFKRGQSDPIMLH